MLLSESQPIRAIISGRRFLSMYDVIAAAAATVQQHAADAAGQQLIVLRTAADEWVKGTYLVHLGFNDQL